MNDNERKQRKGRIFHVLSGCLSHFVGMINEYKTPSTTQYKALVDVDSIVINPVCANAPYYTSDTLSTASMEDYFRLSIGIKLSGMYLNRYDGEFYDLNKRRSGHDGSKCEDKRQVGYVSYRVA